MAYFNKYYFEFDDIHVISPARWRVDIMDSEGATPTEPFLLTPGAQPLVTERIDTSEDKFTPLIGRQVTITYAYTGAPNEPLPDEFFESQERRFRVEVRKNGVLDGVYFVKPDFSQYPDKAPPFNIQLKAVDGMGYTKGSNFDAYDTDGALLYDKISLYDALVTRSLNRIFDPGTIVNVVQSLKPADSDPDYHFLFDNFIHTDIFYDFVEGPKSVHEVLSAICKNFNARVITDQNQIWFVRVQDLNQASITVERYSSESIVTTEVLSGFIRVAGQGTSFDAIPINLSGGFITLPAIKKTEFEVDYRGINVLQNFNWSEWDGTFFANWGSFPTEVPPLNRVGTGTPGDPYRAFMGYVPPSNPTDYKSLAQIIVPSGLETGDIVQCEITFEFYSTKVFGIAINAGTDNVDGKSYYLTASGEWQSDFAFNPYDTRMPLGRSGKKRYGSFTITSNPLPVFFGGALSSITIALIAPEEMSDELDGPDSPGVFLGAVKLAVVKVPSKGRRVTITNAADFSQVKETEKFTFIDTGEDGLSNTIFTGASKVPVNGWESPKSGVETDDIERHMAKGIIDQYQRSVNTWQGQLYSNSLSFYNMIRLAHKPDKLYLQAADRYDNRACTHDVTLVETFEEGTADIQEILEFDIEDTEE